MSVGAAMNSILKARHGKIRLLAKKKCVKKFIFDIHVHLTTLS